MDGSPWAPFSDIDRYRLALQERQPRVTRLLVKALAENDNSKQQIYIGAQRELMDAFPVGEIQVANEPTAGERPRVAPTFLGPLDFAWMDGSGQEFPAPHAKVIFYPSKSETRLSGFLMGCANAPDHLLRAVPKDQRRFNNEPDGRVLALAITADGRVLGYMAEAGSPVANALIGLAARSGGVKLGMFVDVTDSMLHVDVRGELIERLRKLAALGPVPGAILSKGVVRPYTAPNGAGYTLEAHFGIDPNASRAADFHGWELKAGSGSSTTLMTPNPTGGLYRASGLRALVSAHGAPNAGKGRWDFTGTHYVGKRVDRSRLTMRTPGFDPMAKRVLDAAGAVTLVDEQGNVAASWRYADIANHVRAKLRNVAYVKYLGIDGARYHFTGPAILAEGCSLENVLTAMNAGVVVYDPGCWCRFTRPVTGQECKERHQFRVLNGWFWAMFDRATVEVLLAPAGTSAGAGGRGGQLGLEGLVDGVTPASPSVTPASRNVAESDRDMTRFPEN